MPPIPPINIEAIGLTKPAPGVIATRPTTIPLARPSEVTFFLTINSHKHHVSAEAAADVLVVINAFSANHLQQVHSLH